MIDPLQPLLTEGVVDEVCGRLKSGKEADLWLVRHGGEIVAAKLYKARERRSFRNDSGYKEGRSVRDSRTQRAMNRGSRFGRAAAEDAWKEKEWEALYALHAAGVRVPKPVMFYEGVLLMELVLDAHGRPAPRLVDAAIPREEAARLYADLRAQAVRILCCDLIHGDLSPYNVLMGAAGQVVIDFPQVVGAAHNSQAERFFLRDLENVRRFFAGIDPALNGAASDGREIWRAYVRRELTPDFVPPARAPDAHARPAARPPLRSGAHAEHHRRRPESHPQRAERATADRRAAAGGSQGRPPAAAPHGEPHRRHGAPSPRVPGRAPAERRPSPEVIRVVRPVRGSSPAVAPAPRDGAVRPGHAAPAPHAADAPRPPGRRRRRRR